MTHDRTQWEKRTLWENSARVPLVIRAPWLPASVGARTSAPVELVDIYKTVCDVLGVPLPMQEEPPVEGTSLLPLLRSPRTGDMGGAWDKDVALTTYPRCPQTKLPAWKKNGCIHSTERTAFAYMGYSMLHRNATSGHTYRYTEWLKWNGTSLAPARASSSPPTESPASSMESSQRPPLATPKAVELYNHTAPLPKGASEFDSFENVNLAAGADSGLLRSLSDKLRGSFAIA